jgi:hypothetical protein
MRKAHGYIIERVIYYDKELGITDSYSQNNKYYATLKHAEEAISKIRENYPTCEFRLVEMFETYTGKCSEGIHWYVWFYENNRPVKRKCRFCEKEEIIL